MNERTGLSLLRHASGLDRVDFSKLAGMRYRHLFCLETREAEAFHAKDAITLSKLLGVPLEATTYRVDEDDEGRPPTAKELLTAVQTLTRWGYFFREDNKVALDQRLREIKKRERKAQ